jgi:hypothetical protein
LVVVGAAGATWANLTRLLWLSFATGVMRASPAAAMAMIQPIAAAYPK